MSDTKTLDARCRNAHPERIEIGGTTFIRDDVMARRMGVTPRTQTRGDKDGAPHAYFGGVKYRPELQYGEFLLDRSIKVKGRAAKTKSIAAAEP